MKASDIESEIRRLQVLLAKTKANDIAKKRKVSTKAKVYRVDIQTEPRKPVYVAAESRKEAEEHALYTVPHPTYNIHVAEWSEKDVASEPTFELSSRLQRECRTNGVNTKDLLKDILVNLGLSK